MILKPTLSIVLVLVPLAPVVQSLLSAYQISHNRRKPSFKSGSQLYLFGRDRTGQLDFVETEKSSSEEELYAEIQQLENGKATPGTSTETLRFGGRQNYTSPILPLPSNHQSLFDFFAKAENHAVLLTGGKAESSVEPFILNLMDDVELIDVWKTNAKIMEAEEPDETMDQVLKVLPAGIKIITISVCPESLVGVKLTTCKRTEASTTPLDGDSSSIRIFPEFQVVLIEDEPKAIGPKFLVWLFNKVVYGGDPESIDKIAKAAKKKDRKERALLRVWAELVSQSEEGDDLPEPSFVFKADTELRLEFGFPRLLLKFFPLSKSKAEEITSAAINRELTANIKPAIDRFSELYMDEYHNF